MKKIICLLSISVLMMSCSDSDHKGEESPSFSNIVSKALSESGAEGEVTLKPGSTYVLDSDVELVRKNLKVSSGKNPDNYAVVDCRFSEKKIVLKRRSNLEVTNVKFKNCLQIAEIESGTLEMLDSEVIGDSDRGESNGSLFELTTPRASLIMDSVLVRENSTSIVLARKGSLVKLRSVSFIGNKGMTPIKIYSGKLVIDGGSEFTGNQSNEGAGVIRAIESQEIKISDSTFSSNEAGPAGRYERRTNKTSAGVISAFNSRVEILDSIFNGNFGEIAGAIDMDNRTRSSLDVYLSLDGVRIFNHEVNERRSAGAINLNGVTMYLDRKDSEMKENYGENCGGINLNHNSQIALKNPTLAGVYINSENNSSNRRLGDSNLCNAGATASHGYIR